MNSISTHSPRFLEFLKFSVGSRMDSAYSILTLEPSLLSNQPFALFKEPALSAVEGGGPRTRPATRISDGRFSEAPLRDATQADQEHEGLAQFYNCSYEQTLLISSSYDCGARASIRFPRSSGCGTEC